MFDLITTLDDLGKTIQVKVTPKAKCKKVKFERLADGSFLFRVYITEAAEKGKANKEVILLLAEALNLPPSSLQIIHGHFNRNKIVEIKRNA